MKENTVKLSGHSKDRFLERFFAAEPELEAAARQRLTERAKSAFTSLRVRKAAIAAQRPPAKPKPPRRRSETVTPALPAPSSAMAVTAAHFDAYAFGLVPVFQREGRDGLLARLAGVASIDQLRQMAKAQQIILPPDLRAGDAAADAIRSAIADAVAKRIADRRAAAG